VLITYRAKIHGTWTKKTVKAQIRSGRYHALMKLPSGWKHARGAKLSLRYAGSSAVKAETKRLTITRG
jgi:hypothetical protein